MDLINLESPLLRAEVSPVGAELRSLRTRRGRELLWQADPRWWGQTAPLLFPIIGRAPGDAVRHEGRAYPMPLHGFAHATRFDLVVADAHRCAWRLRDNARTRASYPFAFELLVTYAVHEGSLESAMTVHNTGSDMLPVSFGFHPGFRWPLLDGDARDDHRLVLSRPERPAALGAEGGFLADTRPTPLVEQELRLSDDHFGRGALILSPVQSDAVSYRSGEKELLRVSWSNCSALGIWTKPGAEFICIEPWHGLPGSPDSEDELLHRPGVTRLAPGQAMTCAMTIEVSPQLLDR